MTDREAMQQALEALEDIGDEWGFTSKRTLPKRSEAITALRERLAQPEQEPVGEVINERGEVDWISFVPSVGSNLYTTPPQRKPLTENELFKLWVSVPVETEDRFAFARAVEAARGIKGEA